jgi:hypothetical protein
MSNAPWHTTETLSAQQLYEMGRAAGREEVLRLVRDRHESFAGVIAYYEQRGLAVHDTDVTVVNVLASILRACNAAPPATESA